MVHANLTPLQEIIDDPNNDKIFLVMPYLNTGSLEERIEEAVKSNNTISEEEIRSAFRQLVSALHYCHEVKNVAHRGIKPSNMMFDLTSDKLKLCDFGLYQFFEARAE